MRIFLSFFWIVSKKLHEALGYELEVFTDRISIWISIWSWINAGYGSDFIVLMDMDMDIRSWIYITYKNNLSNILKSYKLHF